jgi:hypothetical protein
MERSTDFLSNININLPPDQPTLLSVCAAVGR